MMAAYDKTCAASCGQCVNPLPPDKARDHLILGWAYADDRGGGGGIVLNTLGTIGGFNGDVEYLK